MLSLERLLTPLIDPEILPRDFGTSVRTIVHVDEFLVPGCKFVVKAQVLAGGRGKGHWESGMQGGVKLAQTYVPVLYIALSVTF